EGRKRAAEPRDLLRGEMHDRLAAVEASPQRAGLGAVEFLEVELRVLHEAGDVGHRPVREVVDTDDLVSVGEQPLTEMRADETCRAGDTDSGHFPLLMKTSSAGVSPPVACSVVTCLKSRLI